MERNEAALAVEAMDVEKKQTYDHVEDIDALESEAQARDSANGTVGLTNADGEVLLVPHPSADPSGMSQSRRASTRR